MLVLKSSTTDAQEEEEEGQNENTPHHPSICVAASRLPSPCWPRLGVDRSVGMLWGGALAVPADEERGRHIALREKRTRRGADEGSRFGFGLVAFGTWSLLGYRLHLAMLGSRLWVRVRGSAGFLGLAFWISCGCAGAVDDRFGLAVW